MLVPNYLAVLYNGGVWDTFYLKLVRNRPVLFGNRVTEFVFCDKCLDLRFI